MLFKTTLFRTGPQDVRHLWPHSFRLVDSIRDSKPIWERLLDCIGLGAVNGEERDCLSRSFEYAKRIADHVSSKSGPGTLLAENQCRDLSFKLTKTSVNIQELVIQFDSYRRHSLFEDALEEFCVILEKAWVLVEDCSRVDWHRAAVFQVQNEEAFREILLEVGFCYDVIYEQASWGQRANWIKKAGEVQDLRQSGNFLPAQPDKVLQDLQTLQKRLQDWLAKNPGSSDDQILISRYLQSRVTRHLQLMEKPKVLDIPVLKTKSGPSKLGDLKFSQSAREDGVYDSGPSSPSPNATRHVGMKATTESNEITSEDDGQHWEKDLRTSDPILLQVTETQTQRMWDVKSSVLSSTYGSCVLATRWVGIPCAKKTFLDVDAADVNFRKEAGLLSSLNHPNIIKFFCCGNDLQERQSVSDHSQSSKHSSFDWIDLKSTLVKLFRGRCIDSQMRHPGLQSHKQGKSDIRDLIRKDLQKPQCFIGMELMEMSLLDLIKHHKTMHMYFSEEEGLDIILQTARGMCYLHDLGVAHRDLKPGNVVVSPRVSFGKGFMCVKLVDFGLSKTKIQASKSDPISYKGCGTTIYRAPEIDPNSAQDGHQKVKWFKADVFSFALTCAAILSLKQPSLKEVRQPTSLLSPEIRKCPNYELLALLEKCWATEPEDRPDFLSICATLEKYKQELLTKDLRAETLRRQWRRPPIEDCNTDVQSVFIDKMLMDRSQQRKKAAAKMKHNDEDETAEASSSKVHLDPELGETSFGEKGSCIRAAVKTKKAREFDLNLMARYKKRRLKTFSLPSSVSI